MHHKEVRYESSWISAFFDSQLKTEFSERHEGESIWRLETNIISLEPPILSLEEK